MISLGATDEPIELSAFELLFKSLAVDGALTGTPAAGDATLRFSAHNRRRRHGGDHAAREGRGSLRKDDGGTGAISDGSDHGLSTAPSTFGALTRRLRE